MGSGAAFVQGKFDEYRTVKSISGIKVIEKISNEKESKNTPMHSHSKNAMYARMDEYGNVVQISVYENNTKIKDIDWGHKHGDFNKGDVHVHTYDGFNRSKAVRRPTEEEMVLVNKVKEQEDE